VCLSSFPLQFFGRANWELDQQINVPNWGLDQQMTNNTRTIDCLLEIMDEPDFDTHRRIDAAEQLLGFEAPEDVVVRAREFLISIFESKEEGIADRMNALKIARKSEAAKVTPRIVRLDPPANSERDRKEAWRHYEMSVLKRKIYEATGNTPLASSGWCDAFGDDYLPPEGDDWPDWTAYHAEIAKRDR
jgi:hypothetical protein